MALTQQIYRALITADAGGAIKEYRKYEGQVEKSTTAAAQHHSKAEKAMGRVKLAAAAIGVTAAVHIGKHAVDAAKNLEEAINAVNVMYGENASEVLKLSENAAEGVGLSMRAFDEAAVSVGGFVNQIADLSGEGAAEVLDDLITRAADFASVFNIDVDEALQRFRSGLAGETEPLRRFGINLLQSEVSVYALANGIIEVGEKMTEEEKTLVRYRLLMEKTDSMAGDFAATSDGLANSQRILRGSVEDLAAEFGEQLAPHVATAVQEATNLVEVFGGMPSEMQGATVAAAALGLGILTIGANATAAIAALGLFYGEYQAISAGIRGDQAFWADEDVGLFGQLLQPFAEFGDNLGASLAQTIGMSGEGYSNRKELQAINDAETAGRQLFDMIRNEGITTWDEYKVALDKATEGTRDSTAGQHNYNIAFVEGAKAFNEDYVPALARVSEEFDYAKRQQVEYVSGLVENSAETKRAEGALADHRAQQDRYVAGLVASGLAVADHKQEQEEALVASMELWDATKLQVEAMWDHAEAAIAMVGGDIAVRDANRQAAEALEEYNETADKTQELTDGVAGAMLAAADQAADYAEEQATLAGETFTAKDRIDLMRESLLFMADQLAPGDPLRLQLLGYRNELALIPTNIQTTVTLDVDSSFARNEIARFGRLRPPGSNAGGTDFWRGGLTWIGERGPELVNLPRGSKVHSASESRRMAIPAGTAGGGGNLFSVTVNAGLGANGADIGRQVVEEIKRFERRSGTGWRAA